MSEREPVTMMAATTRLDYVFTAGVAQSKNLHGLEQGKFIGQRCPKCKKVYVPVAGLVPDRRRAHRRDRRAAQHRHRDHVLRGQRALRRPVDRDPLHLRARSCSTGPTSRSWASSRRSRPTRSAWACGSRRCGCEPEELGPTHGLGQVLPPQRRARRRLRDLQGVPVSDVPRARLGPPPGRGGVLRPVRQRAARGRAQRGRDAHAGRGRGVRQHRHHQGRRRLHLLGLDRLPGRRAVLLRRPRSTPSACGRPGPSPTSRWTAPGRSTRPGCCCRRARSTPPSSTASGARRRATCPRSWPCSSTRTTWRRCGRTRPRWPRCRPRP